MTANLTEADVARLRELLAKATPDADRKREWYADMSKFELHRTWPAETVALFACGEFAAYRALPLVAELLERAPALLAERDDLLRRLGEVEAERDSWREQFHSAASAASTYSEFWEQHASDFDVAGNYIPHSQMDGDLRDAERERDEMRKALEQIANPSFQCTTAQYAIAMQEVARLALAQRDGLERGAGEGA